MTPTFAGGGYECSQRVSKYTDVTKDNLLQRRNRRALFVSFGLNDFFAAVVAGRRDVVTQMGFTRSWLNGKRRIGQKVVRAMHATL